LKICTCSAITTLSSQRGNGRIDSNTFNRKAHAITIRDSSCRTTAEERVATEKEAALSEWDQTLDSAKRDSARDRRSKAGSVRSPTTAAEKEETTTIRGSTRSKSSAYSKSTCRMFMNSTVHGPARTTTTEEAGKGTYRSSFGDRISKDTISKSSSRARTR
jgi:hypothetical protein